MSLIVDSVAPVTLRVIVRRQPGDSTDFTTISAATISARKPRVSDEAYVYGSWIPTITPISDSVVHLIYPFIAGDVDRVGVYSLRCRLTVPAGIIPCDPVALNVVDAY